MSKVEVVVKNVMQCPLCGGTVDRYGTRESEAEMAEYVAHRDDPQYRLFH